MYECNECGFLVPVDPIGAAIMMQHLTEHGVASASKTLNTAKALNDPTVECCGRDAADCDCPPEVPCLCQGLSHQRYCPNWELPY